MIGLSDRWSLSVTKLLMVVPLMLYGHLLVWQPCGLYAHHLYGWACGLKVYQLYDELVNFSTCQLPPYSFVVSLDDGRNNDGLHSIWQGICWFHSHLIERISCHISGRGQMSFIHWLDVRMRFFRFSRSNFMSFLTKPLISLFGLLSSPSFWVLSLHFLISSS